MSGEKRGEMGCDLYLFPVAALTNWWWLKTIQISFPVVFKVRSLKWVFQLKRKVLAGLVFPEASGEKLSFSSVQRLLAFLGLWLHQASLFPSTHRLPCPWLHLGLVPSFKNSWVFWADANSPGYSPWLRVRYVQHICEVLSATCGDSHRSGDYYTAHLGSNIPL